VFYNDKRSSLLHKVENSGQKSFRIFDLVMHLLTFSVKMDDRNFSAQEFGPVLQILSSTP